MACLAVQYMKFRNGQTSPSHFLFLVPSLHLKGSVYVKYHSTFFSGDTHREGLHDDIIYLLQRNNAMRGVERTMCDCV